MSLLIVQPTNLVQKIADRVFAKHFEVDGQLKTEYDERRRRHMQEDIHYVLECLTTSVRFDAEHVFTDFARWMYNLLRLRMTDLSPERIRDQMAQHYELLMEAVRAEWPKQEQERAIRHLERAIVITKEEALKPVVPSQFASGEHGRLRQDYLNLLLQAKKQEATELIEQALDEGLSLEDLYVEVFQTVMYEIGQLWHAGTITVDKEHYCTAITQHIMAQLYPRIFATKRLGLTMLGCCVGNELHEMGIRMVCDIFELHGWDTVYLGAAVPLESIVTAIGEHRPDLVALSVTMTHHLDECQRIMASIRGNHQLPPMKIAIGGRAVQLAPHLPQEWGADVSTANGMEFVQWANQTFLHGG